MTSKNEWMWYMSAKQLEDKAGKTSKNKWM
jgi:hypothetical protein